MAQSRTAAQRYWLLKSEPDSYSIDDLERDGRTCWDGVRNYQARNFMRDDMKPGDLVLYYHSGAAPAVAGIARVSRAAYPDHTQFDPNDSHHDPKSKRDDPTWVMVDIEFVERFDHVVSLAVLKSEPSLEGMLVTKRGQRLSVQPVEKKHFELVRKLGRA